MPNTIAVAVDEFACTNDPNEVLTAEGVSTCIAFALTGWYWDNEDNQTKFCALHHWSGFGSNEQNPKRETKRIFTQFLKSIRTYLDVEETQSIAINTLDLIGGETKQHNDSGELLISGTEREVAALTQLMQTDIFHKNKFIIDPRVLSSHHFLTQNRDTIDITLTINKCTYVVDKPGRALITDDLESDTAPTLR